MANKCDNRISSEPSKLSSGPKASGHGPASVVGQADIVRPCGDIIPSATTTRAA